MADTVDSKCLAYQEMSARWDLLHDLLSETPGMRAARQKWIRQEEREAPVDYEARIERSFLFPGLRNAISDLVSKPFSAEMTVTPELPDQLAPILKNADRCGRTLSQMGRDVFQDKAVHGLSHVLVDYPRVDPRAVTYADEAGGIVYPYFAHVKAEDLFAWRYGVDATGRHEPTMIRYYSCTTEPDGVWGEEKVERVIVWTKDSVQTWIKQKEAYVLEDEVPNDLKRIPLHTTYCERTGFLTAKPPLEDLAWLNLAHWQSSSQQRNYLHFIRVGILFAKGLSSEERDQGITVGPRNMFLSTSPDADVKYVEHGGAALEAGERDLSTLEAHMRIAGMQPYLRATSGPDTATGRLIDESSEAAGILDWIRDEEQMFEACFVDAADRVNVELPDDFSVDIFSDFNISMQAAQDAATLLQARSSRQITQATYLAEMKRRGFLSESLDVEAEVEETSKEGPSLAEFTQFGQGGQAA